MTTYNSKTAKDFISFAVLFWSGAIIYAHTINAPWYFDDYSAILGNINVKNLSASLKNITSPRGISFFTFAINYSISGTRTFSYHYINIFIHLSTGFVCYLLFKRIFNKENYLPLLAALIFICHPLQTQAVTYIVQRMTSLAALLFFLSLYFFVLAQERIGATKLFWEKIHIFYYASSIFFGILACYAKENTVILPFILILFYRFFLPQHNNNKIHIYVVPYFIAPCIITFQHFLLLFSDYNALDSLSYSRQLLSMHGITPLRYFLTQFAVIWKYLRLFFLPYGQALDHNVGIITTFPSAKYIFIILITASLPIYAYSARVKKPLLSFGILWFLITLSVESTFIPLDPLFEHRMYLPIFGLTTGTFSIFKNEPNSTSFKLFLVILLLILCSLTWKRNQLWNDPIAFYHDNLKKVPRSERVLTNLAIAYFQNNKFIEAESFLHRAIAINAQYGPAHFFLGKTFFNNGKYANARIEFELANDLIPNHPMIFYYLARLADSQGDSPLAMSILSRLDKIDANLAIALRQEIDLPAN